MTSLVFIASGRKASPLDAFFWFRVSSVCKMFLHCGQHTFSKRSERCPDEHCSVKAFELQVLYRFQFTVGNIQEKNVAEKEMECFEIYYN